MKQSKNFHVFISGVKKRMATLKVPGKIIFFVTGIISTLWFLIRVIPKPSRAAYPCMRIAAPFMSGFVLYILAITGAVFTLKKIKEKFHKRKYVSGIGLLIILFVFGAVTIVSDQNTGFAKQQNAMADDYPADEPFGTGQGIYPGRVVWTWNPHATNEDLTDSNTDGSPTVSNDDDYYYLPKNNNQDTIDNMLSVTIQKLTGESTDENAWDAMFKYFNKKKYNLDETGYSDGEIVFLKINAGYSTWALNQSYTSDLTRREAYYTDKYTAMAETTPQTVLSMIKQLVNKAGVSQANIYVGDPMGNVFKHMYELIYAEFPNVNFLSNSIYSGISAGDLTSLGRTNVVQTTNDLVFYSDQGSELSVTSDELYTIFEDADYMINMAALKGHNLGGITLCAKNHFGSQARENASHLHGGLVSTSTVSPNRNSYGLYRVLVDIMQHDLLGNNTLLFFVDALYGGSESVDPPVRFQTAPFNNDWTSSLFASLDQVALESVCFDFLRTEFDGTFLYPELADGSHIDGIQIDYPNYGAVDDYLHQAADSVYWPVGISYDPENDGIKLKSIGVHEHWYSSSKKFYSGNFVNGTGIELISIPGYLTDTSGYTIKTPNGKIESENSPSNLETFEDTNMHLVVFPNPANSKTTISVKNLYGKIDIAMTDMHGRKIKTYTLNKHSDFNFDINLNDVNEGFYLISVSNEDAFYSQKLYKLE